jgi:hypothetical protein
MSTAREIVKVQVPLFVGGTEKDGADPACLVYDRGQKHVVEQSVSSNVFDQMGADPKGYFEANWTGKHWVIGRRVEDKRW